MITPHWLKTYYEMDPNRGTSGKSTMCVFEGLGEYYSPADLNYFFKYFNMTTKAKVTVIGPNDPEEPGDEASLDIEYIMATAIDIDCVFYSFDDDDEDPIQSFVIALSSRPVPPLVNSISYGGALNEQPATHVRRFDTEMIKLSARGVTMVVSSGDDGCAGYGAREDNFVCNLPPWQPTWPACSPWVTAVGATMLNTTEQEIVATAQLGALITTGGGFSTLHDRPAWQNFHLNNYFATAPTNQVPPSGYFVTNKRGFPDVAIMGHNYVVVVEQPNAYLVDGTSASAPVFAGMVALMNDDRLKLGMTPMGFVNPFLYQVAQADPSIFTDVDRGDNRCTANCDPPCKLKCCQYGYYAVPGWDPTTGLGTPNVRKLRNKALSYTPNRPS